MKLNKKIQATGESFSCDERKVIDELCIKDRDCGKIEFLMSFSGVGDVPDVYNKTEFMEFQLISDSLENLEKLELEFDSEIYDVLGSNVKILSSNKIN